MHTIQSPIKVAFFYHSLVGGGAEKVSVDTAHYLHSRMGGGDNSLYSSNISSIHFISYNTPRNKDWKAPSDYCKTYFLPNASNLYFCPQNAEAMAGYINRHNIQIIFIVVDCLIDYIKYLRKNTSCKIVYWSHLQPNFIDILSLEKCEKCYLNDKLGGFQALWNKLKYTLLVKPFRLPKNKKVLRDRTQQELNEVTAEADAMIVLCPNYKQELISQWVEHSRSKKIYPILNTIPINPTPILEKKKRIAFVGRLDEEKRVDKLLDIWAITHKQVPDWTLHIYGKGNLEEELRAKAKKLKLPRVFFEGYTSNVQEIYDNVSIICLTSVIEGVPLVFLEAQNNAVIPIAYNINSGIQYIVGEDNQFGYAIPPGNKHAFSQQLIKLCSDDSLRAKLQERILQKRKEYHPEVNDSTWEKLFSDLGIQLG